MLRHSPSIPLLAMRKTALIARSRRICLAVVKTRRQTSLSRQEWDQSPNPWIAEIQSGPDENAE